MAKIKIAKHEKINLSKESDRLRRVRAVLGWNTPDNVFPKYDLDVSAFLLDGNAKLLSDDGFIFYGNETAPDGSVWKSPDEREGGTEELYIDITKLSPAVAEISIVVTIHKAVARKQNFGQVKGSYIEIFNDESGEAIAVFHLDQVGTNDTSVQVGSFYQTSEGFTFQGVGSGFQLELDAFVTGYGGEVE